MSDSLLIVTTSIIILLILLLLAYFLRRNTEITVEGDTLVLTKPFKSKKTEIDLEEELDQWSTQQLRLILWGGVIHGVGMRFKSGKQLSVTSRFNQETYQRLYQLLESKFQERKVSAF